MPLVGVRWLAVAGEEAENKAEEVCELEGEYWAFCFDGFCFLSEI